MKIKFFSLGSSLYGVNLKSSFKNYIKFCEISNKHLAMLSL
ncbi:unnamed protein product [Nezara viridula]|uniref:Uncharacterized protein n=1 Tax=Nezara viridula TaxID=85310 RepID=A0A9P0GZR1_NEZVI|nr:unnamed protein product [Nezara viridula]